jgi:hypothetical protein
LRSPVEFATSEREGLLATKKLHPPDSVTRHSLLEAHAGHPNSVKLLKAATGNLPSGRPNRICLIVSTTPKPRLKIAKSLADSDPKPKTLLSRLSFQPKPEKFDKDAPIFDRGDTARPGDDPLQGYQESEPPPPVPPSERLADTLPEFLKRDSKGNVLEPRQFDREAFFAELGKPRKSGVFATTKRGQRAAKAVDGQLNPRKKRALRSSPQRSMRDIVADVVSTWQATRPAKANPKRQCLRCHTPLPYRMQKGAKYCPGNRCKNAATLARAAEIERNRVFRTAESVAQDKADREQRFSNYCQIAVEMWQTACRIGRDDVIFFPTPDGIIVAHDGAPLPELRVTVFSRSLPEPRRVKVHVASHNYTTRHPDVLDLMAAERRGVAELSDPSEPGVKPTVAPIPRSSWYERGSYLDRLRDYGAYQATIRDLLAGPELRAMIYTVDDSAYSADLEQKSYWEFRFRGDPGTGMDDDFEGVWPEFTPEEEASFASRRKLRDWVEKRRNTPRYTHPDASKDRFWLGRDYEEFAHGDLRRIDSDPPKPPPVEHLFDEGEK